MNRELLEEAANKLGEAWDACQTGIMFNCLTREIRDLIARINAFLATPNLIPTEMVEKIRAAHEDGNGNFALSDSEAAALIEAHSKRVPRAMLEELRKYWRTCAMLRQEPDAEEEKKIADKHSVKVEE